ncbi:uncharacterized protein LOC124776114 [Schistocerca piceifrons]|uniref:uncharacterized protein LOC124776114 n=1 Tax=Schistocerca piceifrons TaxID=274613 RepID=UPI001F5FEEF6|nr:uncharacterized protein LOC124776114 [Schistocerca piceifrons]
MAVGDTAAGGACRRAAPLSAVRCPLSAYPAPAVTRAAQRGSLPPAGRRAAAPPRDVTGEAPHAVGIAAAAAIAASSSARLSHKLQQPNRVGRLGQRAAASTPSVIDRDGRPPPAVTPRSGPLCSPREAEVLGEAAAAAPQTNADRAGADSSKLTFLFRNGNPAAARARPTPRPISTLIECANQVNETPGGLPTCRR